MWIIINNPTYFDRFNIQKLGKWYIDGIIKECPELKDKIMITGEKFAEILENPQEVLTYNSYVLQELDDIQIKGILKRYPETIIYLRICLYKLSIDDIKELLFIHPLLIDSFVYRLCNAPFTNKGVIDEIIRRRPLLKPYFGRFIQEYNDDRINDKYKAINALDDIKDVLYRHF